MADNTSQAKVEESTSNTPAQETQGTETDWKVEARKWEDRAKANRDEVRALKTQLAQTKDSSSDLEKALNQITVLKEKNAELEHSRLVTEIAGAKGIKASLLHGTTREELEANADELLTWRAEQMKKPAAPLLGHQPSKDSRNTAEAENRAFLRQLIGKE